MARSRYKIFEAYYPYFFTATIVNWLPLFSNPSVVQIILDSLQFLQAHDRLTLNAYVIMENHVHVIASSENLSKEIGDFKSFTARKIIDLLKEQNAHHALEQLNYHKLRHKKDRDYQFWQEGSHPQQVSNVEIMRQKIDYIHYNPVKRGYIDDPTHWRYSSARNYAGQAGLLPVSMDWF